MSPFHRHSVVLARAVFTCQFNKKCYCKNLVSKRLPILNQVITLCPSRAEVRKTPSWVLSTFGKCYFLLQLFIMSFFFGHFLDSVLVCMLSSTPFFPFLSFCFGFFLSITKEFCCCFISLCFFCMAVTSMAFGMSGMEKSAAKQIVSRNFFLR